MNLVYGGTSIDYYQQTGCYYEDSNTLKFNQGQLFIYVSDTCHEFEAKDCICKEVSASTSTSSDCSLDSATFEELKEKVSKIKYIGGIIKLINEMYPTWIQKT